jgi:hypothetical protein
MMIKVFTFTTDTATLSIFDLASLKHRVNDDPDWWSIPEDELDEINKGNILFLNLGDDGNYTVEIHDDIEENYSTLSLRAPSGKIYLGAGEDTSGCGLEPDGSDYMSGVFLDLAPGYYDIKFKKVDNKITVSLSIGKNSTNDIKDLIRL